MLLQLTSSATMHCCVMRDEDWNNRKDKLDVKHDIALIKIRRKGDGSGIQLSGKSGLVRPACLPSKNTNDEDAKSMRTMII